MMNPKMYMLCVAASLLITVQGQCQTMNAGKIPQIETNSRTVEDGGTGPYTDIMVSDS